MPPSDDTFENLCIKYAQIKQRLIVPHDKFELPDLRRELLENPHQLSLAKNMIKSLNARHGVNLDTLLKGWRLAVGSRKVDQNLVRQ